ncbi:nitroreductase family protein [Konateibacter massiliensis]|uniref:nitroreductase family protein n=1 Tax=Konateibacter massiliensis TaxID=2002841 RepID=UPI000C14CA21|nr:nitroreductase family protein [Konateibacter massiliensis]
METFDTIFSRKSVRSYTGKQVSQEELDKVLKAANASPVAMAQYENMHITVIQNEELLQEIEECAANTFQKPGMKPLYNAPTLIVLSSVAPKPPKENALYSNAAIMAHNMALAATDLNLGSCYIWGAFAAVNQNPDLVKKLNLPEGFVPCCGITLGETTEKYEERDIPAERFKTNYIK